MLSVPMIYRVIAVAAVYSFATVGLMTRVSRRRPFDVYLMSFLFSLAFVLTVLLAVWAYTIGAIDEHGVYQGQIGQAMEWLLRFGLGLSEEITLVLASLLLLTVPQVMAYVMSGLFGSASRPLFLEEGLRAGFWFVVKSLPTIAGILVGLSLVGSILNWPGFDGLGIARGLMLASILMCGCYLAIIVYTEVHLLTGALPLPLRNLGRRVHRSFTRRSRVPETMGRS